MLQVYLVRHGETQWNAERRIQGQSDSPLTAKGEQQAMQVATRAKELGITHIISSDLGRTRRTAEIIAQACGCDILLDPRLRELNMGVLETRNIDSLTEEEKTGVASWSMALSTDVFLKASLCRSSAIASMRHWNLAGTYRRKPTAAGEPRYCTGMPGEYDSRITSMGRASLTSA